MKKERFSDKEIIRVLRKLEAAAKCNGLEFSPQVRPLTHRP